MGKKYEMIGSGSILVKKDLVTKGGVFDSEDINEKQLKKLEDKDIVQEYVEKKKKEVKEVKESKK